MTGEKFDLYALDIETTGLNRFKERIIGIGVYSPGFNKFFRSLTDFTAWYHSLTHTPLFITHRGSFDVGFLRHFGCDIRSHWHADTRSMASIMPVRPGLAEGQKYELGLENLAIQLLGHSAYKIDRTKMAEHSLDEVEAYCLKDCELTYKLHEHFCSTFSGRALDFTESWLMPATKFCADLEYDGVPINVEGLRSYQAEIRDKRDKVLVELNEMAREAIRYYHERQVVEVSKTYKEMYERAKEKSKDKEKCLRRYALLESAAISRLEPFNWNSSEQLKWLLRDYYCLDIRNDREDKETTNEAMLRSLDHPVAKKLCDYRELEKLCSTCIPALLENSEDSVVHASYNIGGTRTGRLSSSGPNLQQIPRGRIRSFIQTDVGKSLVTIDYAQIEVRIIAELAKEKELIDAFKKGIDPYSVIAQKLLKIDCPVREIKEKFKKERDVSKTAGLSILYGTGPAKLQEVLKKELGQEYSVHECRRFIEDYRNDLPGVKELRTRLDRALANGKICFNLLGRPFAIDSNDEIYMKGLNTLVQGSASDLVIWSQTSFVIPALKELGVNFTHRMVIHDEVVIELPANEADFLTRKVIVPAMTTEVERALNLRIPLSVEYNISREWSKP